MGFNIDFQNVQICMLSMCMHSYMQCFIDTYCDLRVLYKFVNIFITHKNNIFEIFRSFFIYIFSCELNAIIKLKFHIKTLELCYNKFVHGLLFYIQLPMQDLTKNVSLTFI